MKSPRGARFTRSDDLENADDRSRAQKVAQNSLFAISAGPFEETAVGKNPRRKQLGPREFVRSS
jgi:hypothetical protein